MKKVLLRGPALSLSGYGHHTRFVLRSLRQYQERFDIYLINVPWGQTGFLTKDDEERAWIDEVLQKTINYVQSGGQFDISIQVTIPNEWERLAPVNIGVTAGIETDRIAPQWIEKSNMMDKIIVCSEHSKYGFDNTSYQAQNKQTGEIVDDYKCTTPIEVVHYPWVEIEEKDLNLDLETDFNFLVVAQWGPRKNIENTVKWFVEEFFDQEVGLVLKLSYKNNSTIDRDLVKKSLKSLLKKYEERKCKVYLLHGDLSDEEMTSLYRNPKVKCLVNASHGEGFGLPMFEAGGNGLLVSTIDWSGQVDFLTKVKKIKKRKGNKIKSKMVRTPLFVPMEYTINKVQSEAVWDGVIQKDSNWAFVEQGSFKLNLRKIFKNFESYASKSKMLKKHIRETFAKEKQYQQMADSIYKEEEFEVEAWLDELGDVEQFS